MCKQHVTAAAGRGEAGLSTLNTVMSVSPGPANLVVRALRGGGSQNKSQRL